MVPSLVTNPSEDKATCSMCNDQAPPPSYDHVIQMTHDQGKYSAGKDVQILSRQQHAGHQCCGCQCSQQKKDIEEVLEFSIEERPPGRMKVCLGILAIFIVVAILCLVVYLAKVISQ